MSKPFDWADEAAAKLIGKANELIMQARMLRSAVAQQNPAEVRAACVRIAGFGEPTEDFLQSFDDLSNHLEPDLPA